jgi:hypothetical protein
MECSFQNGTILPTQSLELVTIVMVMNVIGASTGLDFKRLDQVTVLNIHRFSKDLFRQTFSPRDLTIDYLPSLST